MEVFKMFNEEILSAIDNIDRASGDSETCVIESIVDAYDKSFMIMENYENDERSSFSIFQEGEILDTVKKESKKDDNKFITILMFIPRLIRAFIKSIKPPKDAKETANKLKNISKEINSLSRSQKEKKVKELNEQFNGKAECYLDEKSGKIKFKRNKAEIINKLTLHLTLVFSTYNLYKRISSELDVLDPSNIRLFVDDCDKVIHGDKSISKVDLFESGIEAFGDALSDFFAMSSEITVIGGEISTKLENIVRKDMIKDVPNEKKQEIIKNMNNLVSRITNINTMISAAVGSLNMFKTFGFMLLDLFKQRDDRIKQHDEIEVYVRQHNPKIAGETETEYKTRLMELMKTEEKRRKEAKKQEEKDAREKAKQEWKERRNKDSSST